MSYSYLLYLMLEDKYRNSISKVFPRNWYLIKDYNIKNNILIDVLMKNKIINENDIIEYDNLKKPS